APSASWTSGNTTLAPEAVWVETLVPPTSRSTLVPSGSLIATVTLVWKPSAHDIVVSAVSVSVDMSAGETNDPEQLPPSDRLLPPPGLLSPQPASTRVRIV